MVKIDVTKVTIGTDPEVFLERNGEIISAEGLIGGTKLEPKSISDKGHAVQEDNVMAEFNIPPSKTEDEFCDNINYVLDYLEGVAALNGATVKISACETLDKKYLNTDQARMFGCDPDYNVYKKEVNPSPNSKGTTRTAAGHIHIGYPNPSTKITENLIKSMDLFINVPLVLMEPDNDRKSMYGKAGAFRFKEYGFEGRTPSNYWISSDDLIKWTFRSCIESIEFVNNEDNLKLLLESSDEIVDCINNNNKDLAIQLLEKFDMVKVINNNLKTA